ncbi:MFS transporter, partial [Paenarthrobacter sp. RAF9]
LHEPPAFAEAQKTNQIAKLPVADLLRLHWRDVLRVVCCAFIAAISTVFSTLAIKYAKDVSHVDGTITLWLVVVANIVALGTQPLFGMLADKIGRKPVFIYGAVASAIMTPVFFLSFDSGSTPLMFLAAVVYFSFGYAAANAVWPAFYGEMFSTKVRFSGLAIGTQVGFLMAGFAPTIVTAMGGTNAGGWVQISYFSAAICAIAVVAALTARESAKVPTAELGLRK